LAEELVALAFRKSRAKNFDFCEIAWPVHRVFALLAALVPVQVRNHRREEDKFLFLLQSRFVAFKAEPQWNKDFLREV
jgi:hypothetical protein